MEIWQNQQIKDLEGEIWKPIKNYEGLYDISNMGRVKSLVRRTKTKIIKEDKILTLKQSSQGGYIQCKLNKNSKFKMPIVSRLVAEHFCTIPNYKWVAAHKNNIRWDNRADNLECISQSKNVRYSYETGGKSQQGEKNNQAKISMEIAKSIRQYQKENDHLSRKDIAKHFDLTISIVKDVLSFKSWDY